jgi:hypothetical protein
LFGSSEGDANEETLGVAAAARPSWLTAALTSRRLRRSVHQWFAASLRRAGVRDRWERDGAANGAKLTSHIWRRATRRSTARPPIWPPRLGRSSTACGATRRTGRPGAALLRCSRSPPARAPMRAWTCPTRSWWPKACSMPRRPALPCSRRRALARRCGWIRRSTTTSWRCCRSWGWRSSSSRTCTRRAVAPTRRRRTLWPGRARTACCSCRSGRWARICSAARGQSCA